VQFLGTRLLFPLYQRLRPDRLFRLFGWVQTLLGPCVVAKAWRPILAHLTAGSESILRFRQVLLVSVLFINHTVLKPSLAFCVLDRRYFGIVLVVALQNAACPSLSPFRDRCPDDGAFTFLGTITGYVLTDLFVVKLLEYSECSVEPVFALVLALEVADCQ
jgi:hypothetical protein